MKKNINLVIARFIALAQVASDAGKGIYSLKIKDCKAFEKAKKSKYSIKDFYILCGINLINKNKTNWRYSVERMPDQNGHVSKVIIFTLNTETEYLQISFHSFAGGKIKELALKNAGSKLFWDKKSSRISIFKAYTALGGKAFLKI